MPATWWMPRSGSNGSCENGKPTATLPWLCANAIKTGRKSTEEELAEVLATLADLDVRVEQHTQRVLRKTNAVAWAYNLTWYDAVYVALAETLGFPCVTADEALLRKMKGHSIVLRLKDLAFE